MLTKENILAYLKQSKQFYKEKYHITKLGLFGSFARDEQTEKSDIDIIIEMEPDTPEIFEKKQELKKILREKYQREIDLCNEKYIKPIFKPYIIKEAIYV